MSLNLIKSALDKNLPQPVLLYSDFIDVKRIKEELYSAIDQNKIHFIHKEYDNNVHGKKRIDFKHNKFYQGVKNWKSIPLYSVNGIADHSGTIFRKYILHDKEALIYQQTKHLDHLPQLKQILSRISNWGTILLARLMRLGPGGKIPKHKDPVGILKYNKIYNGRIIRCCIPISTGDGVIFGIEENEFYLQPGCLYYTPVHYTHWVENKTNNIDRIHLVYDIALNIE